jgi:hypothetical protein
LLRVAGHPSGARSRWDGSSNGVRLKVRSLVGLLPLAATTVLPADLRERLPRFFEEAQWFLERHPHTAAVLTVPLEVGAGGSRILSLVNPDKLRRMLGYMLNENLLEVSQEIARRFFFSSRTAAHAHRLAAGPSSRREDAATVLFGTSAGPYPLVRSRLRSTVSAALTIGCRAPRRRPGQPGHQCERAGLPSQDLVQPCCSGRDRAFKCLRRPAVRTYGSRQPVPRTSSGAALSRRVPRQPSPDDRRDSASKQISRAPGAP